MTGEEGPKTKAVGAADMDAEHELLHDILHQLQEALTGDREDDVSDLLDRFVDTANLHFMEEQSLMRLHAYPGYAAHQQEHDNLIAELDELARRITAGDFEDAAKAAQSLEKWFMTHMNTTDAAFETFLEEEGIRAPSDA